MRRAPCRIACLAVPLFPLAARLRSEPELRREALAICEGSGHAARVVAANRLARRAGITAGQTLPQARALLPGLLARGRDPECERAAQQALLEVADRFSPRVEDGGDGIAFLEIHAAAFRPAARTPAPERKREREPERERDHERGQEQEREREIAQALLQGAERSGLAARVGLASSKLAARVAAAAPASPVIVPAGEEEKFLAPLPLGRLTPALELAETLRRWGLRSIGDLARLPADAVASRLGEAGRALHRVARGEDAQPLQPRLPPPDFHEGLDLEWPLVALEPFLFIARAALERLTARLAAHGLGCVRLGLHLRLEPDGSSERAVDLPAPTRDTKTLLELVRLELEARPPGAPVVGFRFTAQPDRPRSAQLSLLGPAELSPDRLATTLARLFALLGPGRVGSPRTADGHRPERFRLVPYAPPPAPLTRPAPAAGKGLLGLRVLRPPVELEVLCGADDEPGSTPRGVRSVLVDGAAKRPRLEGAVRIASGPWRLEEGWWTEEAAAREYWDVELEAGGLYRIYRDALARRWFADGIYD